ncbi:tail protein X [Brenneria izbisi]|uniref:Tail protein X n=1 Tax=Brenneria izbisi TaxID=2939450 RepID=A0AA41XUQ9_9GAMM|nr:tail protein X [Brenneria izbisi]MCV9878853.1 tail protein X [Brenneria izbisi]MCV9882482.1 tail protein X [Brenneria izbisi]
MYIEHVTKQGDRWDLLAHHYYGEPRGYDRIIAANPQVAITPVLPSGIVLLIPMIETDEAVTTEEIAPWLR